LEGPALTGYAHIETKLLAQLQYIILYLTVSNRAAGEILHFPCY